MGWVKLSWFLLLFPFFVLLVVLIMISFFVVNMAKTLNNKDAM